MAKYKQGRLAGEIQKEISQILSRELTDPRLSLVSVIDVTVAPDGCSAKVYISPLKGDIAEIKEALASAKGFIRRSLGQRLKARTVPELYFQVDESIAYGIRMAGVIDKQIEADQIAAEGRPPMDESIYKE